MNRHKGNAPKFSEEHMLWLRMIKDHIATSMHIERDDFDYSPFAEAGGLGKAWQLFGDDLDKILEEMNEKLAAYIHIPEVGIVSEKRQNLRSRVDYERLFAEYRATVLKETGDVQAELAKKIQTAGRAALLCFEKAPSMCHRSHLACALAEKLPPSFSIKHTNV